jgi:branched-subunit amino acid aminotransferase/4-amino-4-deoxychorismate lyase
LSGLTWVNGRFVPPGEACLEAGERGFLFGDGLFETVRLYGGRAPAWPRHAARLAEGCRTLGIPYPEVEIAAGLEAVLAAVNRSQNQEVGCLKKDLKAESCIRSGGAGSSGPGAPEADEAPGAGRATGADEGIFFNTRGELAEGTVSNVFLLFDGDRLVTPPVGSGLLPGIAREIVLAVGGALGLAVSEEAARRRDFENAREAWLTNSLLEVMSLVSLDGVPVGNGRPGEIACRVRQAYRDYVQRYFRQGF